MTSKRKQENYRTDDLTSILLDEMVKKTGLKRAEINRRAVNYFAHYVLDQEQVDNLILDLRYKETLPKLGGK